MFLGTSIAAFRLGCCVGVGCCLAFHHVILKSWNFDDEARWITELVANNFSAIMCDMTLLGLSALSLLAWDARREYELVKGCWHRGWWCWRSCCGLRKCWRLAGVGMPLEVQFWLGRCIFEDGMSTLKQQCAPAKFWAPKQHVVPCTAQTRCG
jgi:hypothetical protein